MNHANMTGHLYFLLTDNPDGTFSPLCDDFLLLLVTLLLVLVVKVLVVVTVVPPVVVSAVDVCLPSLVDLFSSLVVVDRTIGWAESSSQRFRAVVCTTFFAGGVVVSALLGVVDDETDVRLTVDVDERSTRQLGL
uniref:Uncharacterized protein n=1 Tax=Romanomermis culicivorax TaxID=13658 RepID=A0A915HXL6_ROMCU